MLQGDRSAYPEKEIAMSLAEEFLSAQERVNRLSRRPADMDLLELYGLYKQATLGDAGGKRPGSFDFKGRAKWEAWKQRKGMSREEAMKGYVEVVDRVTRELV